MKKIATDSSQTTTDSQIITGKLTMVAHDPYNKDNEPTNADGEIPKTNNRYTSHHPSSDPKELRVVA
jgi:hypothetical protein